MTAQKSSLWCGLRSLNLRARKRVAPQTRTVGIATGAKLVLAGLVLTHGLWGYAGAAVAATEECPFCSAASQTLRQESQSMDAVAIASLQTDGRADIDGNATFVVERVLRGESLLEKGQKVEASYFGPGKSNKKFLLLGVDPKNLVWSSPLPLSEDAEKYIDAIQKLPEDPIARLEFYQKHFEHPDSLLARDSYDEFALAPYEDVKKLKDKMNREQLMEWIRDPEKSPDRKRLYYTMLGICGTQDDAVEFESMIRSNDPEKRAGLDALIASYLMLRGPEGLKLIDEQFLTNRKASYPDVYSSVMALRFHGTEGNVIPKEDILKSMRHLIEAPDLADLVIPDLARWSDWSQIDRLTELFKKSNDDNSWVRVPVVNYLRACPLPEAKEKLKELEKIDPKAVKRAATFFPIPSPAPQPPKKDPNSSSMLVPESLLIPESRPGKVAKAQTRLVGQAYQGLELQQNETRPIRVATEFTGMGERSMRQGVAVSSGSASTGGPSKGSLIRKNNADFRNSTDLRTSTASRTAISEELFENGNGDRVAAVNSLTLLAVVGCGGAVVASLMWMVACGMFAHEFASLQRWVVVRR